jgi:predicted small secreted protein
MKRFKMILALTVIASALSACGTVGGAVSGMGQDLSKAGDWIKNK